MCTRCALRPPHPPGALAAAHEHRAWAAAWAVVRMPHAPCLRPGKLALRRQRRRRHCCRCHCLCYCRRRHCRRCCSWARGRGAQAGLAWVVRRAAPRLGTPHIPMAIQARWRRAPAWALAVPAPSLLAILRASRRWPPLSNRREIATRCLSHRRPRPPPSPGQSSSRCRATVAVRRTSRATRTTPFGLGVTGAHSAQGARTYAGVGTPVHMRRYTDLYRACCVCGSWSVGTFSSVQRCPPRARRGGAVVPPRFFFPHEPFTLD